MIGMIEAIVILVIITVCVHRAIYYKDEYEEGIEIWIKIIYTIAAIAFIFIIIKAFV